jgi:hypothetical protein
LRIEIIDSNNLSRMSAGSSGPAFDTDRLAPDSCLRNAKRIVLSY